MSDISRIKLQEQTYDIKDALLRHQMNVLLGIEPPDDEDANTDSEEE